MLSNLTLNELTANETRLNDALVEALELLKQERYALCKYECEPQFHFGACKRREGEIDRIDTLRRRAIYSDWLAVNRPSLLQGKV